MPAAFITSYIVVPSCAGLLTMYSSGFDHGSRFEDHARNMLIAGGIMFVMAQVPPQRLMAFAVPIYLVGVTLLVAVAVFGVTKKGARRWLNLGVVIQPSEILKIAMPLMLAWWFQKREGQLRPLDFLVGGVLLAVNLLITFTVPNISWQGHLGGFAGGALVAALLVYAPRGPQRATYQLAGLAGVLVLLLAGLALRLAA